MQHSRARPYDQEVNFDQPLTGGHEGFWVPYNSAQPTCGSAANRQAWRQRPSSTTHPPERKFDTDCNVAAFAADSTASFMAPAAAQPLFPNHFTNAQPCIAGVAGVGSVIPPSLNVQPPVHPNASSPFVPVPMPPPIHPDPRDTVISGSWRPSGHSLADRRGSLDTLILLLYRLALSKRFNKNPNATKVWNVCA